MVRWEGAVNAHLVAPGLVRMARREWLTQRGWEEAARDGYLTVVDLRGREYAKRRDGDPIADPEAAGVQVVYVATEDPDHPERRSRFNPYLDHPRDYDLYCSLFCDRVLQALRTIAGAPSGVIVHCAGGRDRTGLVVALGQALAGWDFDEIVAGYERGAIGINEQLAHFDHPYERHMTGDEWDAWLGERLVALREFLEAADVRFMLRSEGATDAELDEISSRFSLDRE